MKHAKFEKLMSRLGELPTLPVVAQKVIEVIHDERSSARMLKDIIELDPVISAKLVRMANSAYYHNAGSPPVADVQRAIVVLGFMCVRNVVLATCLHSLYSREFRTRHFCARDLWIHSVNVAVSSRTLAKRVQPRLAEEAFLAGLVHDVGMIVEWNLFRDEFPQVVARFLGTGVSITTAEEQTLGFDHTSAGAAVLRKWQMPKDIRDAAAHHHDLLRRQNSDNLLPEIIQVAERVSCARGDGFFDFTPDDPAGRNEVLAALGLADTDYDGLIAQTGEEIEKARDLLEM